MADKKWVLRQENVASYGNTLMGNYTDIVVSDENTIDNPIYLDFALRHVRAIYNISIGAKFTISTAPDTSKTFTLTIPKPTYYMRFRLYKNSTNSNIVFSCERYGENGEVLGEVVNSTAMGTTANTVSFTQLYHATAVEKVDIYEYTDVYDPIPENSDPETLLCTCEAAKYVNNLSTDLEPTLNDYSAIIAGTEIKLPYYVRRNLFNTGAPYVRYAYSTNGGSEYSTSISFSESEFRYFRISFIEDSGIYAVCRTYDKYGVFIAEERQKISTSTFANFRIRVVNFYCNNNKTYTHSYVDKTTIPIEYEYLTERNINKAIEYSYLTERNFASPYSFIAPTYRINSISGMKGTYENLANRVYGTYENYTYCEMERGDFIVAVEFTANIKSTAKLKADLGLIIPFKAEIKSSSTFYIDTKRYIEVEDTIITNSSTFNAESIVNSILEANIKANTKVNSEIYIIKKVKLDINFNSITKTKSQMNITTSLTTDFRTDTITSALMKRFVRRDDKITTLIITKKYDFTTYIDDEVGL